MLRTLLATLLAMGASTVQADSFTLQVDGADAQGRIAHRHSYNDYGCTGQNVSPALHWQGQPANAGSLALTVFDPDAPTGHGFWHWVVLNLPATSNGLAEGAALPAGAVSLPNDFGQPGWGGPCPPAGDSPHHYVFTVYALDLPRIALAPNAPPGSAERAMRGHILGKAQQTLTFGR
jgi:Raf kinase inhibitor-like YbhB/YbcL family protein